MKRSGFVFAIAGVAALTFCFGCESTEEDEAAYVPVSEFEEIENVTYNDILSDLTPELLNLTQRPVDTQATFMRTTNADVRMFWDDWGRVGLVDRPSRLTHRSIP